MTADVEFFNNANEFIYLNTVRGTGARTVIRAEVESRRTITDAGMLPGTPPDGGAIDTVDVTVDKVSREVEGETRNYITTPGAAGAARATLTGRPGSSFTYADGITQTVPTPTPCRGRTR